MAGGPNGVSGQSVAVDVDRANRTDKDPVPTPGRGTVGGQGYARETRRCDTGRPCPQPPGKF